jgi:hypothetical protein
VPRNRPPEVCAMVESSAVSLGAATPES